MKHKIVIMIILFCCSLLSVQPGMAGIEGNMNGDIRTDQRLRFDPQEFTRNEARLHIKFEGEPIEKYHYFAEAQLKGERDLTNDDQFEWEFELREGYLDLYNFLSDQLDVRIGKQIIAWGKADKLNPTSNVSPDNLEDIFDFGEKLGVNAVQAAVYWGDMSVTGIFIPEFGVAELPSGDFGRAFAGTTELPSGMTLRNSVQHTLQPESTLDESSAYAVKISTVFWEYDVSLSYFAGRDDLPLANIARLTAVDELGTVDLDVDLIYPKMQVIGADVAGQIKTIGVWAEGALFLPDKVDLTTTLTTLKGIQSQGKTVALDDEPYFKYVLGMDYTFKNGWYVNAQFVHGFFHERGRDELSDYTVFRFEKDFLNAELTIAPVQMAIAIPDWDDIDVNHGVVGMPEITYRPADNIELILGAYIITGKGPNMFSEIKDQDQMYFKAKVSF
ncbi:hypothetical protein U27_02934 [Candidatus Vecturithrix granuli]|uniref:Alginate export domain-containing protein n=1 Tax=Vecturithrix granuli TaxID=1499967 RepID=A0A081BUG8_VECG1|nr:hypothetical protein U27_02934 [Candidatus Vecturithrix granuli]